MDWLLLDSKMNGSNYIVIHDFYSCLHIPHCNHSHDKRIGMVEYHVLNAIGIHVKLNPICPLLYCKSMFFRCSLINKQIYLLIYCNYISISFSGPLSPETESVTTYIWHRSVCLVQLHGGWERPEEGGVGEWRLPITSSSQVDEQK